MATELTGFSFLEAENTNKARKAGKGVATLVNAQRTGCGQRLVLSKQLQESLEIVDTIQILVSNDGNSLLLGTNISDKATNYNLRKIKKNNPNSKLVLYNSSVVNEITRKMHIPFEENVSVTFYGVEYFEHEGKTLAEITLKGEE
jgi:hypothetical protein